MPTRRCKQCSSRLSTYNAGDYCNACWNKMSVKLRRKNGKRDAYNPEPDLRREVRERDAIYDDRQASSGAAPGID